MKKNRIRLTESQLRRIIKESVKKVLREDFEDPEYEDFSLDTTGSYPPVLDFPTRKEMDMKHDWAYFDNLKDSNYDNKEWRLEHELGKAASGRKNTIANRNTFDHPFIRHGYVNNYLNDLH